MSEFLDEMARSLARPMPRSRALRMIGGAVVAAAVPGLRPRPASARSLAPKGIPGCPHTCNYDPKRPVVCSCPGPTSTTCFNGGCGEPGSVCCCQKQGGRPVGAVTCPPGYRCGQPPGEPNCVCVGPRCGPGCCKPDEECCGRTTCCKPNEECVIGRAGMVSAAVCLPRCPQGRARCGPGKCCPTNWRCADESRGLCQRCKPTQQECGKKCCEKATHRCCGNDVCCPKARSCCKVGGKDVCCPANTKCAKQITPGNIGLTRDSTQVCCPKPRHVPSENLCCPPGKTALTGPGLRVGPGLEPYCCANDQVCRSGSSVTCCQKSAILGSETCCNGKCVDLRFNPQNCGSCGNVCESGICSDGICAFP